MAHLSLDNLALGRDHLFWMQGEIRYMTDYDPLDHVHQELMHEIGQSLFLPPFSIAHDSAGWWEVQNKHGKAVWMGGSRERAEERKAEFERKYGK